MEGEGREGRCRGPLVPAAAATALAQVVVVVAAAAVVVLVAAALLVAPRAVPDLGVERLRGSDGAESEENGLRRGEGLRGAANQDED